MLNTFDLSQLPTLVQPIIWDEVTCIFKIIDQPSTPAMISNINIVPFTGDLWVVVQLEDGSLELPGGTCEPGEHYLATARRELMEEAGAKLHTFVPFGIWECHSSAPHPFRPHIPHPEFHRLVGYSEVELVGAPTNPHDGERVASVLQLTLEDIQARFAASGRSELAELYALAAHIRQQRS
ncbi:MAG: NUDIX domain-containing protein [Herpetosiphonaceae bacterium]|nr:NUDIX domain-containing protein [Herpetosiphonaceae bacterium]